MNEMTETKTPKPGEWWVSDSGVIAYMVGLTLEGDPAWQQKGCSRLINFDRIKYFLACFHHEPRCTGFDWVEPPEIYPGAGWELLPIGTRLQNGDEYLSGSTWVLTGNGSKDDVCFNTYRRKIKPAEVWPKWIIGDHWSDTAYVRRDSADENSAYTIDGKKREHKNGKFGGVSLSHTEHSIDILIANKTWRYVTEAEALARVQHPTLDPDDVPLNPVPGKVVATGTVNLTPVQPDDWVEFDPAHITCPRISIDWLTLKLGESEWGPALLAWSNATWAAQRENWKIRCYRRDLPIKTDGASEMNAIVAASTLR